MKKKMISLCLVVLMLLAGVLPVMGAEATEAAEKKSVAQSRTEEGKAVKSLSVVKEPYITTYSALPEYPDAESTYIESAKISLDGMVVRVGYEDGTYEDVQMLYEIPQDSYGNILSWELYDEDKSETVYFANGLEPGNYNFGIYYTKSDGSYVEEELEIFFPITVLDFQDAVDLVKLQMGQEMRLNGSGKAAWGSFDVSESGQYTLSSQASMDYFAVFDEEGNLITDPEDYGGYSIPLNLEGGKRYSFWINTGFEPHCHWRVALNKSENQIEGKKTVASIDFIQKEETYQQLDYGPYFSDIQLLITYTDQTMQRIDGDFMDPYGNEFYMEVCRNGERVDEDRLLSSGEYELIIVSQEDPSIRSKTKKFYVEAIDLETLPWISEEVERDFPFTGERELYRFKPSFTDHYYFYGQTVWEGLPRGYTTYDAHYYEQTVDGFVENYGDMIAGKEYLIVIESRWDMRGIMERVGEADEEEDPIYDSSPGGVLKLGITEHVQIGTEDVLYTFTPERTEYFELWIGGEISPEVNLVDKDYYNAKTSEKKTEDGTVIGALLEEGQEYTFSLYAGWDGEHQQYGACQIRLNQISSWSGGELVLGQVQEVYTNHWPANEEISYTFTPKETAIYNFRSIGDVDYSHASLYYDNQFMPAYDEDYSEEHFLISHELEAGKEYTFKIKGWNDRDDWEIALPYQILIEKKTEKKPVDLRVDLCSERISECYAPSAEELLNYIDSTIIYEDGSSFEMKGSFAGSYYSEASFVDGAGNSFMLSAIPAGEDEENKTYHVRLSCTSGIEAVDDLEVKVKKLYESASEVSLDGTEASGSVEPYVGTCYKIVPKVTSAYDFEKYGDTINWRLERENGTEVVGGTDGMACLTAGATYYLVLTCRDGILENVPYSFSGKAVKAVTDLQVVSVPQVSSWVLDGQMPRWKGLVVEIMYEDGISQRKDFSDYIPPRWEGVDDGYGNETYINAWKSDKNENFVTVEVYCGDYYASFEMAIEAGENEITRTVTEGINNLTANKNLVRDSVLFTPEKTMIYQVLVQIDGEYCENVEIEAESSSASYGNRHCLAAGKTCMITFTYPKVIDTDAPLVVSVIPDGKTAISHAQITLLGAENLAYTGSELRPGVKVTLDGQTLTEGKDYSISYRNNVNAGNAMVIVKGMGDYAGAKEVSFKIRPMALNAANVGQISDQSYTGGAVCPEPSVMLGGKVLKKGEDYTLSYQNNIQAGTASVTITGKGNYTGSIVRNFTIRSVPTNQEVQTPQKEQQVSKLKVNAKMIPLKIKQSTSKVKITGLAKGDRIVSWTSSKPKVASVSKKGKITGRKMGTAVITVRTANGQKISFKVKVQKKKVTTSSVKLNKKKLQLKKGKSFKLTAAVKPITSVQKVTFTSNNEKVATVSKSGKIKARRKGRAVITVRSGKKKTVCRVNVK